MIKTTECPGMRTRLAVRRRKSMLATRESSRSPAMKSVGSMKSAGAIEVVAIDEDSAVRNVAAVVEENSMTTPVVSPVSPAPAKPAEEADSKAEAKLKSRIRIPPWPDSDRLPVHEPWVIFRNVNNIRLGWFDHNSLPLLAHFFLR